MTATLDHSPATLAQVSLVKPGVGTQISVLTYRRAARTLKGGDVVHLLDGTQRRVERTSPHVRCDPYSGMNVWFEGCSTPVSYPRDMPEASWPLVTRTQRFCRHPRCMECSPQHLPTQLPVDLRRTRL